MKLPFGAVLLVPAFACGAAAAEDTTSNTTSRDCKRYVLDELAPQLVFRVVPVAALLHHPAEMLSRLVPFAEEELAEPKRVDRS